MFAKIQTQLSGIYRLLLTLLMQNPLLLKSILVGPDGSFVSTGNCNMNMMKVPGSNPGLDGYLSSWLCIYMYSVQRHIIECTVLPMVLCTIKNP